MDGMKTKRVQLKQLLQEQLQKIQPGIMDGIYRSQEILF